MLRETSADTGTKIILTTPKSAIHQFEVGNGTVSARIDGDVIRASGIPYARAERFSPPVPLLEISGTVDAHQPSPACPQNLVPELDALLGLKSPLLPSTEDCLNLSVTVPNRKPKAVRPVMVWIHGGSYVTGAGDLPIFDVAPLSHEQDVVVVSVTYRLGLFGFLGGYSDRPANLGLLDIIAALKWIKEHIKAFGGDPDNITLFGESAGGDAIAHLVIADGTEGLFNRAIVQSAPLGLRHGRQKMSAAMGEVAASVSKTDPVETVLETQQEVIKTGNKFGLNGGMPFSTQYGHHPLPKEEDAESVWADRAKHFDVLIGYNSEETALFVYALPRLLRLTKIPLIGGVIKRLFVNKTTAKIYGKPANEFAARHSKSGGRAFVYEIDWCQGKTFLGACHTVDLPLLFADFETWKNAKLIEGIDEQELVENGEQLRKIWADFAKTGELDSDNGHLPNVIRWKKALSGTRRAFSTQFNH